MTAPLLRPGGGPANLLLELWAAQAKGERWVECWKHEALPRLIELEYVSSHFMPSKGVRLTLAGQIAAQALEASS